jgi:hypothetical protein
MMLLFKQMEPDHKAEGEGKAPATIFQDEAALDIIRTETVMSKLPIHNLSKKGRVDIRINKTGPRGEIELKWEVSYNTQYGQPGQLAYKLDTIVIDSVIDEAGRPLPERLKLGSLRDLAERGCKPEPQIFPSPNLTFNVRAY